MPAGLIRGKLCSPLRSNGRSNKLERGGGGSKILNSTPDRKTSIPALLGKMSSLTTKNDQLCLKSPPSREGGEGKSPGLSLFYRWSFPFHFFEKNESLTRKRGGRKGEALWRFHRWGRIRKAGLENFEFQGRKKRRVGMKGDKTLRSVIEGRGGRFLGHPRKC